MTEDQVKFVQRPKRTWREPSPIERLAIIQEQIRINDLKPTDLLWCDRDTILRRRESAILLEIEAERIKNATSR